MIAYRSLAIGLVATLLSTACATASPTASPAVEAANSSAGGPITVAPPAGQLRGGMFQPLDSAACRALAERLSRAVNTEFTSAEADFVDLATNQSGRGCQASAQITGSPRTLAEMFADLKEVLIAEGWARTVEYQPAGPNSMAAVFIQRADMCQLNVIDQAAAGSACAGKSLAVCTPPAAQTRFVLTVNCARYVGGAR